MYNKRTQLIILGLAQMAFSASGATGVKITANITQSKNKLPLHLFFEKTKVRLDSPAPNDPSQTYRIFYDAQTENLSYVDNKKKTFLTMPVAQMEILASLALKLQQRGKPAESKAADVTFKDTGKTKKISQWTCKIFEIHRDKKKMGDLCAAPLKDVGLTKTDILPMQKLSRALEPLVKVAPGNSSVPDYLWKKIEEMGLTLEANGIDPKSGETSTFLVSAIERPTLPADTFSIPPGYTPQALIK
jgi:hypothetical protein